MELYDINYDKVVVIGRGVDTALFKPINGIARKNLLFVGRLIKSKGYEWILKVYQCLLKMNYQYLPNLLFVGGTQEDIEEAKKALDNDFLREASID